MDVRSPANPEVQEGTCQINGKVSIDAHNAIKASVPARSCANTMRCSTGRRATGLGQAVVQARVPKGAPAPIASLIHAPVGADNLSALPLPSTLPPGS